MSTSRPIPTANPLEDFSRDLLLRDGAMLQLRALRPGDRGALKDLLSRCSPYSQQNERFFNGLQIALRFGV